jgi:hypothetical protein
MSDQPNPYAPLTARGTDIRRRWRGGTAIIANVVDPKWADHLAEVHNRWLATEGSRSGAETRDSHLAEALRHLKAAEELVPENTKGWRFLQAARLAVEVTKEEVGDE